MSARALVLCLVLVLAGCWDFQRLHSGCREEVWHADCKPHCAPAAAPVLCVLDAAGDLYYFSLSDQPLDGQMGELQTPDFLETCPSPSTQFLRLRAVATPAGIGVDCEGGGQHVFGGRSYYRSAGEVAP